MCEFEDSLLDQVLLEFADVLSTPLPPEHFEAIKEPLSEDEIATVERMLGRQLEAFHIDSPQS